MATWAIIVTILGAFAIVGAMVGLNVWQESKHVNKNWWLTKND